MTFKKQLTDFTKFWSVPTLVITILTAGIGAFPMILFWLVGAWIIYYDCEH